VATGDAYTEPAHRNTDAVMAIHMDTGQVLWSVQDYENDAWLVGFGMDSDRRYRGLDAVYVHLDVTSEADWQRAVQTAVERYGKLDVLVNNAAIIIPRVPIEERTAAEWDQVMAVNAKGVFLGTKHAIPAMRRAGGGSIINVASFVAVLGAATPQLAYTSSKGAVLAMSRELAAIHAREKIRVNALCPGPLRTELLMKYLDTEAKRQRRLVHVPMGRFGEAAEIAKAALFLASDESSFTTGATFLVDGGITAAYTTPE